MHLIDMHLIAYIPWACISQGVHLIGLYLTGLHLLQACKYADVSLKLTGAHTSSAAASSGAFLLTLLLTLRGSLPVIGYGDGRF
jgi:hypothetical protein